LPAILVQCPHHWVVGQFEIRQLIFGLEGETSLPHNASMIELHPFTFEIEPDPLIERRYRWTIREDDRVEARSPHSYATAREAEIEAQKAVSRRISLWSALRKS
jgi:hypothetical protein